MDRLTRLSLWSLESLAYSPRSHRRARLHRRLAADVRVRARPRNNCDRTGDKRQRRARNRLRDWLILLLRTAAIALFAFMIARPLSQNSPLAVGNEPSAAPPPVRSC